MTFYSNPRYKEYVLNPRGTTLYEDSNRFGTKMLEKMGWSKGQGLGAKMDGNLNFIRVSFKDNKQGFGFVDCDDEWTKHENEFNTLLKSFDDSSSNGKIKTQKNVENISFQVPTAIDKNDKYFSGVSLETQSKKSRARVHYKKFTQGKDLSRYNVKDLANIFGRKSLQIDDTQKNLEIIPIGDVDDAKSEKNEVSFGVTTIEKTQSVEDYFSFKIKNKSENKLLTDKAVLNEIYDTDSRKRKIHDVFYQIKNKNKTFDGTNILKNCKKETEENTAVNKKKANKVKEKIHTDNETHLNESIDNQEKTLRKNENKQQTDDIFTDNTKNKTTLDIQQHCEKSTSYVKSIKNKRQSLDILLYRENSNTNGYESKAFIESSAIENKKQKKKSTLLECKETTVKQMCSIITENQLEQVAKISPIEIENRRKKPKKSKKNCSKLQDFQPQILVENLLHYFIQHHQQTNRGNNLSTNIHTQQSFEINTFKAEIFRFLDLNGFRDSTLSTINGYGYGGDMQLKVVAMQSDAKKLESFWDDSLVKKYGTGAIKNKEFKKRNMNWNRLRKTNLFKGML